MYIYIYVHICTRIFISIIIIISAVPALFPELDTSEIRRNRRKKRLEMFRFDFRSIT